MQYNEKQTLPQCNNSEIKYQTVERSKIDTSTTQIHDHGVLCLLDEGWLYTVIPIRTTFYLNNFKVLYLQYIVSVVNRIWFWRRRIRLASIATALSAEFVFEQIITDGC